MGRKNIFFLNYQNGVHSRLLTITHDLLTILELLDVPFGSFTSLKDAFGTSHSRLLTITHDFSFAVCVISLCNV